MIPMLDYDSLADSILGKRDIVRTASVKKAVAPPICPMCHGTKTVPDDNGPDLVKECPECKGTGKTATLRFATDDAAHAALDPNGKNHNLRITCLKCANVTTCRCGAPKIAVVVDVCRSCKADSNTNINIETLVLQDGSTFKTREMPELPAGTSVSRSDKPESDKKEQKSEDKAMKSDAKNDDPEILEEMLVEELEEKPVGEGEAQIAAGNDEPKEDKEPKKEEKEAAAMRTCPGCQGKFDASELAICEECGRSNNKRFCFDCLVDHDGATLCKACAKAAGYKG